MLGSAFLTQSADLDASVLMPPIERLAFAITLLILSWAFLSADFIGWRNRSNLFFLAGAFLLALLYLNSARDGLSAYNQGLAFNATDFAPIWSAVLTTIPVLGLLLALLNYRHMVDAPLKILFFLLFIAGNAWDLSQFSQAEVTGDYLGGARLAYAAGLVLLPLIIYRLAVALLENSLVEVMQAASQAPSDALPSQPASDVPLDEGDFAAMPLPTDKRQLLDAIGLMMEQREGSSIAEQIVTATLETLSVELCILLDLRGDNRANVIAGYDQVAEQSFEGFSIDLTEQATINDVARQGEPAALFPEDHSEELRDLFQRLNISSIGSVNVLPLLAQGELVSILLVSMPYRQADLAPEEMDLLRDIGVVAGNLLRWSFESSASKFMAEERAIEKIAAKDGDATVDHAELIAARRELELPLEQVSERIARLIQQIAELKEQWQELQTRLSVSLDEAESGAGKSLNSLCKQQTQLRDTVEKNARALLDAETILRIFNVSARNGLSQVIQEYLHKEYNLLLNTRDRLRRQLNHLLVMSNATGANGITSTLQGLADESAQLDLERNQLQRRHNSIVAKLDSIGINSEFSNMTQLLLQLHAERKTLGELLADAHRDRTVLLEERQRRLENSGEENQELTRQLKHLSADHEQLLNSREEMRREQQELLGKIEDVESEKTSLQSKNDELQTELSVKSVRQEETEKKINDLIEERDNLLKIRDQLTSKINAATTEGDDMDSDKYAELAELQATVQRLTEQREQLALELSDAHSELSDARGNLRELEESQAETIAIQQPARNDLFNDLLGDLRAPLISIADYTDLLLAESIGILGAAQLQVLRMISDDISKINTLIINLQEVAKIDAGSFPAEQNNIDLLSLIEEVIQDRSADIADKELQIDLSIGDGLPPIDFDTGGLKHILSQFIINACAVSPPGSEIIVSADTGDIRFPEKPEAITGVEICVEDQGGGIALEDIPRLFARKYRVEHPAIAGFGDKGVGIAVARAFARAYDGDLWVTSKAGEGSRFHLVLPVRVAASIGE